MPKIAEKVMVVGGGIAGIQAALDLAEAGIHVILVEHTPSIGGHMAQLDKTFPTNDCSMCILSPKMVEVGRHPNIELFTLTDIVSVEGELGNFKVKAVQRPRYVDFDKCISCASCAEKCPRKVLSEFDAGLAKHKAIYVPFPQAYPLKYSIDEKNCTYFNMLAKGKPDKCMMCKKVCPADAVNFEDKPTEHTWGVSSIILTIGYTTFDPTGCTEYGYGKFKNVLTAMEFERMLSASGPFEGHLKRPADGEAPKRIAFIQCVGSRNSNCGNNYCSSVCCMYGIKEAIIAKEHQEGLDVSIYYMDIRAHGKEFDYYYKRAKDELKIEFINSRVASIAEDDNKNLILNFTSEDENPLENNYDMIVLCTGIVPYEKSIELCHKLDVGLNEYNFPAAVGFSPVETTRAGIYIAGAAGTPIDIPETVASASGSAACAAADIGISKDIAEDPSQEIIDEEKTGKPEIEEDSGQGPPRIGVFICHCGINISKVVDVEAVSEYAKTLPNVVHSENVLYACSQDMQDKIKEIVKKKNLNRVVVSSCTPRTHEPLFQNTITEVGLNPYMFEMTNIREHCSWVHSKEPLDATEKAKKLTKMAVAKSRLLYPLEKKNLDINRTGLVIGGGVAGMTAALELAKMGFEVKLVEREKFLGGNLNQIYSTIDGKDPGKLLKDLQDDITNRDNIDVYLGADIDSIEGYVGNFKTMLKYTPSVIDSDNAQKLDCELDHGTIIVATGGNSYLPTEYCYPDSDRVITQRELEDMIHNGNFNANSVVMIQCVGSRNETHGYCSRICCAEAVKNSIEIRERLPDCSIDILYKDIRTYGMLEDYYKKASGAGVRFMKYDDDRLPTVRLENGKPKVTAPDNIIGEDIELEPDYVVLSTAVRPQVDNKVLSKMLKVPLNRDKFFLEAHMKLRPVDFSTEGVFICGMAHSPKLISETIIQAKAAAMRAGIILSKDFLETEGVVATVDGQKCRGCGFCVEVCPYDAIKLEESNQYGHIVKTARVNEVLCKGCGTCVATCLNGAVQQKMFDDNQLLSMLKNCLEAEEE